MPNATTPAVAEAGHMPTSPDIAAARATARRFLAGEILPTPEELAALRGYVADLIPAVQALTETLPDTDIPRACALACLGEARMRLRMGDGDTPAVRASVAARLARTANALADHHQTLSPTRRTS